MRRTIFTIHLYLALISGLFVFILGATGAIMAFEPEIDRLTHYNLVYVTPQETPRPLAEIGALVENAYPGEHVQVYGIGVAPNESYMLVLASRYVFVDPYSGKILGERALGRTVLGVIHQVHLRLALLGTAGDPGKTVMSWAGVAILVLAVSGLYLWWPLKRMRVDVRATGRRFWFELHNTLGIVSLVFLLILAFTGILIGFESVSVPFLYKVTGSELPAPPPRAERPSSETPIDVDAALAVARSALPGAKAFSIGMPGTYGAYVVRMRFPEDLTPGGRSMVTVKQDGGVLSVQSSRTAPTAARLVILNRAIHTGDVFGLPSKIVMSLASLALAVQAVAGVMMWLKRRASRAPAPGAANVREARQQN